MARKPDPEITQAEPTAARPIAADGRTLDRWGLPIGGPARQRVLDELKRADPNDDPSGWSDASAGTIAALTTPANDAADVQD